jgi:hypothetical protein
LTLRLGNTEGSFIDMTIGWDSAIGCFHGLAGSISLAIEGEQVDIILCREALDDEFLTIAWDQEKHL